MKSLTIQSGDSGWVCRAHIHIHMLLLYTERASCPQTIYRVFYFSLLSIEFMFYFFCSFCSFTLSCLSFEFH